MILWMWMAWAGGVERPTSVTVGVGVAPPYTRLPLEHVAVQHRLSDGFGVFGAVETYSGLSVRPGVQARTFVPLGERARMALGAGSSVWFGTQAGVRFEAVMPELDLGIQGELGPVALSFDLVPTLVLRDEVEFWPVVRWSAGIAF